tara:strand:- start:508 stop:840 length:333 start_codon:yes stop_codon:yes gene_type:complete
MKNTDDRYSLLDIPAFLRVGTPENAEARARGAAIVASRPRPTAPTAKRARIAPTKTEKTRSKRAGDSSVRRQLLSLGYSTKLASAVSISKGRRIIADCVAGNFVGEHLLD